MARDPIQRVLATPVDRSRIRCLAGGRFLPGSWDKRFVREMNDLDRQAGAASLEMTESQRFHIERMAWKYRRQIPADLVPRCEPTKPQSMKAAIRNHSN